MNNGILKVVQGGDDKAAQGTWMCEELALEFASWLSPQFKLWMNDRIRELLKTGRTELEIQPGHGLIKSIRLIADQLEAHEKDIQLIKEDVSYIKEHVGEIEARLIVQDKNFLSIAAYCSLNNIDCPLDKAQRWGYNATVLSKQSGKHFYHIHDPRFGKVGVYHVEILEQIIN
ncbi:MAG: KilA-N domain-containing protein [Saprospiraceae bacterium]